MPSPTCIIVVPKTVTVRNAVTAETVRQINNAIAKAIAKGEIEPNDDTLGKILKQLGIDPEPKELPFKEWLELVFDHAPVYRKGGTKTTGQMYRLLAAFEDAKEGDAVRTSVEAKDVLKKYLEEPDYEVAGQGGKPESIKGWPPEISAPVTRATFPYQDAVCSALDEDEYEKRRKAALPAVPPDGADITKKAEDAPSA